PRPRAERQTVEKREQAMTDDFQLFGVGDGGPAVDADVALVTAYLAQELSPVQEAAVEDRLIADAPFRATARPIVECWAMPGPWSPSSSSAARTRAMQTTSLSAADIDAGWDRHLAVRGLRQPTPLLPPQLVE